MSVIEEHGEEEGEGRRRRNQQVHVISPEIRTFKLSEVGCRASGLWNPAER
jgi:hypothetical protein